MALASCCSVGYGVSQAGTGADEWLLCFATCSVLGARAEMFGVHADRVGQADDAEHVRGGDRGGQPHSGGVGVVPDALRVTEGAQRGVEGSGGIRWLEPTTRTMNGEDECTTFRPLNRAGSSWNAEVVARVGAYVLSNWPVCSQWW